MTPNEERQGILATTVDHNRLLDRQIAEKVFGLTGINEVAGMWFYNSGIKDILPYYSRFIERAFEVLERLRKNGVHLQIYTCEDSYTVTAYSTNYLDDIEELDGEDLPETICKVALLCLTNPYIKFEVTNNG